MHIVVGNISLAGASLRITLLAKLIYLVTVPSLFSVCVADSDLKTCGLRTGITHTYFTGTGICLRANSDSNDTRTTFFLQ